MSGGFLIYRDQAEVRFICRRCRDVVVRHDLDRPLAGPHILTSLDTFTNHNSTCTGGADVTERTSPV